MCILYLGTFGSFIGYAAGFPLLIKSQFPGVNPLAYAWLGPLVGAVVRPFGGWLADKVGGARVTFWNFIVMALAVVGVVYFLPSGPSGGSFAGFFLMFLVLFLTTGIGNGSTFRMIPVIFLNQALKGVDPKDDDAVARATKEGNMEGAATIGFTAAIAAYGGFFIPKSYGTSISMTGGPEAALYVFFVFYLVCIAVTWWYYARRNAPMPC
jgi:NNP family nitrate/nitrite transporter-like MFS transporter